MHIVLLATLTLLLASFQSRLLAQAAPESSELSPSPAEPTVEAPKPKKKKEKKPKALYYSSLGLGKTLPEGFFRIRAVNRFAQGNKMIDADGKAENIGYELSATASALAIEYGMSDQLSFQLLAPFVSKNSLAFNKRQFLNSSVAQNQVSKFQRLLLGNLQAQGVCPDPTACNPNQTLGKDIPVMLPTGEILVLPAAASVGAALQQVPELVAKNATPADGATGLGDVDFGILYSLITQRDQNLGIGLGIRLPLGKFQNVPAAQRPTGEGLLMSGIRINYDYQPAAPVWISFQNLSEFVTSSAKRSKSSLLDPNKLNQADPTSELAIKSGSDGDPNQQTITRKGVGQTGLLRLDLGLTMFGSFFQPLAFESSLLYRLSAPEYDGDVKKNNGEKRISYQIGGKFDGLGLNRPFPGYVRILKETFLKGANVGIATNAVIVEFAVYRSF